MLHQPITAEPTFAQYKAEARAELEDARAHGEMPCANADQLERMAEYLAILNRDADRTIRAPLVAAEPMQVAA